MVTWLGFLSFKTDLGHLLLFWWNWNSLAVRCTHPSLVLCQPHIPVWASGESHKINVCRDLATHHSLGTHSSRLRPSQRAQAEPEASVSSVLTELRVGGGSGKRLTAMWPLVNWTTDLCSFPDMVGERSWKGYITPINAFSFTPSSQLCMWLWRVEEVGLDQSQRKGPSES